LANSTEVVEAVNFNDPAQTVIAGSKAAVEKACEVAQSPGCQARFAAACVSAISLQPDETGR
jgi:malonyl CoA-acyl carrier protein transacylase